MAGELRQLADTHGLMLAVLTSRRSTCARRQVGAVLAEPGGVSFRLGFNWESNGERCDRGGCPRGLKTFDQQPAYAPYVDCVAIHAEAMVLSNKLPSRLYGYTLYVTEEPCSDCAKLIGEYKGLRVVVRPKGEE